MAITQVKDNVASILNSSITDSDGQLTIPTELTDITVPTEGYLLLGDASDLQPDSSGSHPTGEVVKYETFSRNGNGTSTFGDSGSTPLTRGVGNTTAQGWSASTPVGLGVSAPYFNLMLDAVTPQNDGDYAYKNIHSSSEINTALAPGGNNELDIRDWYEKGESGLVEAGNISNVLTTHIADGETMYVDLATLILVDGQPVPSGVDL